ncbi:hypothetical protein [Clostridium beijerinckii]|uniref:hypothetical protein n=1 Tax=Clostridium beijerinckii TaxID=1520 RepID=UPI0004022416|nr:hypothetical protein [Clostridium beijerinckii]NOW85959.1 uncharacterized protein YoxC [Clostridium beijerinckii]NRT77680.1 uncharacterized protein YoxC [Clostridium beijerinckii]OOM50418.1 hypothetical protein CBEIJ_03880 [Clostridium beijerinckii]
MADNNEIFDLLTKMYSEMQEIKEDVQNINMKVDKGFNEVNARIDNLSSGLGKMVASEVADELSEQFKSIKTDVKFIKRKVQDTEEDVFVIQDHLKIIK